MTLFSLVLNILFACLLVLFSWVFFPQSLFPHPHFSLFSSSFSPLVAHCQVGFFFPSRAGIKALRRRNAHCGADTTTALGWGKGGCSGYGSTPGPPLQHRHQPAFPLARGISARPWWRSLICYYFHHHRGPALSSRCFSSGEGERKGRRGKSKGRGRK